MDLPAFLFVDTVDQKWHLRWQYVIIPSRSPDVSMHAADRNRTVGGIGGRGGKKQVCGTLHSRQTALKEKKSSQLNQ